MANSTISDSKLTCPECGHAEVLKMPADSCQWFHECSSCHTLLKPLSGDCCVFCSYGSVPCPSIQLTKSSQSIEGCGYAH
ncbi:MAG: GDCCVxC domain-containing (seleno)protein [Gallionella sp.]